MRRRGFESAPYSAGGCHGAWTLGELPTDARSRVPNLGNAPIDHDTQEGPRASARALQAAEDQRAKIYWSASGEGTPFGTLETARYVRCFDFDADGRQEILVHGPAPLGQMQIVAHPEPRQLENGGAVPSEQQLARISSRRPAPSANRPSSSPRS